MTEKDRDRLDDAIDSLVGRIEDIVDREKGPLGEDLEDLGKERAAYERKYRQKPEVKVRRRAQGKEYYKRNIDKIRAYGKEYRRRFATIRLNKVLQARYRAMPHAKKVKRRYEQTQKRKIARDAYYRRNREKKLEMMRKYYLKNREKIWEK